MSLDIKLENVVAAFAIMGVMIGLFTVMYNGFEVAYGITPTNVDADGYDVMEGLNNINIISGLEDSLGGIYTMTNPAGSNFDILGALASVGIGVVKIITGIITFPVELIGVITGFYFIPPLISTGMGLIFIIYMAFILLGNYTGGKR